MSKSRTAAIPPVNRRAFLARAGVAALVGSLSARGGVSGGLVPYLAGELNALAAKWDAVRSGIRTRAQLEARNRFVRAKVLEMLNGSDDSGPLDATVTSVLERDGYRIENVLYQSRPGLWVSGNLYVPAGQGPFPAVISPCGHYELARMYPDYQFAYLDLVRSGFVVLAYDPTGQEDLTFIIEVV